jgi:hypothetical protein
MLDPDILKQHLAQTEEHIQLGHLHIAHQRELIAELERDHHDSTSAKSLLDLFEQLRTTHEAIRDRLVRDIDVALRMEKHR